MFFFFDATTKRLSGLKGTAAFFIPCYGDNMGKYKNACSCNTRDNDSDGDESRCI